MNPKQDRRNFMKTLAMGAGAMTVTGLGASGCAREASEPSTEPSTEPSARNIKIGHTCITWGTFPPKDGQNETTLEAAMKDISEQGFWTFETFPQVLENWDQRGLLAPLIEKHGLPLQSAFISGNLTDPSKRNDEVARIRKLCQIVKKYQGTYMILNPNGVDRETFDFNEHRADIVSAMNEYATVITDEGLEVGLHQHTDACIETSEEVYAVLEAVNTEKMKFAPDVAQLQKGGADAAQLVRDFLPIITHVHLKDYKGWPYYAGYCPLGMGEVDIEGILDMLESGGQNPTVMVELDPTYGGGADDPMTPLGTAMTSKAYLESLGYTFRA